jgi:acyl carrier protein
MTRDEILDGLRECLPANSPRIDAGEDLLAAGVLDSLTFIDFVSAVEHRFGVVLSDDVVFSDKFSSLSQIADAVQSLVGPRNG